MRRRPPIPVVSWAAVGVLVGLGVAVATTVATGADGSVGAETARAEVSGVSLAPPQATATVSSMAAAAAIRIVGLTNLVPPNCYRMPLAHSAEEGRGLEFERIYRTRVSEYLGSGCTAKMDLVGKYSALIFCG